MWRGFSIVEVAVVLGIVGLGLVLMSPGLASWLDSIATRRAAEEVMGFYHQARFAALVQATPVRIDFDSDTLRAAYEGGRDSTFLLVPGPAHYGVVFTVSRSTIRIQANGWGWGVANTKLVFRRGAAAESLTTSRLGRMKRW